MADRGVVTLSGWFSRQTVVIDDDAVLELDGNFASDRIRRVTFDRIRSITSSSSINYGRVFITVLLFGVATFLLIVTLTAPEAKTPDNEIINYVMVGIDLFLFLVAMLFLFQTMIYRRCQIRIESNVGPPIKVAGSASRTAIHRFIELLAEQVRAYQASLR
jgi:hypothetical protein